MYVICQNEKHEILYNFVAVLFTETVEIVNTVWKPRFYNFISVIR